jgi:MFS transporter, SHS family, sialic acid transporter
MANQSDSIRDASAPGGTAPAPRITRAQWLVLAAAFLGCMFDGVEIGLFPLVARPALQELLRNVGDEAVGWWNGVIVACFLLGAAAGGLIFGWLGDRIGRVRAMVSSILVYSLFTGAGAFAAYAWQLGLFRFIASLGMGGEWAVAVALVVECWPEKHRPMLAGAIGAAANFGFLFIGIVAAIFPVMPGSWRWIMLVGAIPAVLALVVSLVIPESEKWKASVKTARKQPIVEIFGPGIRKKTLLAIVFSAIPLIGTWAAVSGWIPLWVEQMKEAEMVEAQLPDMNLTHAGKGELKDKLEQAKKQLPDGEWPKIAGSAARWKAVVQIVMATSAILWCFVAPVIGGMAGRRPVYFGLCLISLVSCACLSRLLNPEDFWFWPMVWFVGGVTAAFYGWLPLYLPELFPTRMRATGQGLSFNFGRVLAAVGALFMGQLVRVLGGDYGSAIANITLIYVLGLVLIWLAPETKGKPLPE